MRQSKTSLEHRLCQQRASHTQLCTQLCGRVVPAGLSLGSHLLKHRRFSPSKTQAFPVHAGLSQRWRAASQAWSTPSSRSPPPPRSCGAFPPLPQKRSGSLGATETLRTCRGLRLWWRWWHLLTDAVIANSAVPCCFTAFPCYLCPLLFVFHRLVHCRPLLFHCLVHCRPLLFHCLSCCFTALFTAFPCCFAAFPCCNAEPGHGLQLPSPWRIPTVAVSQHVFGQV